MCGILFYLCSCEFDCSELINRGPDLINKIVVNNSTTFIGCVLHHQGSKITSQPLTFKESILLWNGENYDNVFGNDGEELIKNIHDMSNDDILNYISTINGPYSVLFYNPVNETIIFGRDFLGRRSLVCGIGFDDQIVVISSVITDGCVHVKRWVELPAVGLYTAHVTKYGEIRNICLHTYDFYSEEYVESELSKLKVNNLTVIWRSLNTRSIERNIDLNDDLTLDTRLISDLLFVLNESVRRRVNNVHGQCSQCLIRFGFKSDNDCRHSKVAVLFSGGVDSAVVAALTDKFVNESDSIDLLNVAFYTSESDHNESADRTSGLSCLEELKQINPYRKWNFVKIDVYPEELKTERNNRIRKLIQPCNSVLDDSIGCALWFASRGKGHLLSENSEYVSPARVVLTGIGADELMAGYSRHRNTYEKFGNEQVGIELALELRRIASRNMGRDDRVLSSHGREGRFPFLDSDVVRYLESLPVSLKCDLSLKRGVGEKLLLRLVARDYLQLTNSSGNIKRAIQFGSRIAKVDRLGKGGKASEKCDRLNLD